MFIIILLFDSKLLIISSNLSKNPTIFNNTNTNFNERTNNTLNQHQEAINKTLDNTLNSVKRTTDEGTREIPRYIQRIAKYQEQTIQTVRDIAFDYIEAEKQVIGSFQSQVYRNSGNNNGVWDLYNPKNRRKLCSNGKELYKLPNKY